MLWRAIPYETVNFSSFYLAQVFLKFGLQRRKTQTCAVGFYCCLLQIRFMNMWVGLLNILISIWVWSNQVKITSICKSMCCHVRKMGKVGRHLTKESCLNIVQFLVVYRLDCNNSLLYELPSSHLNRMQIVQNNAARVVTRSRRMDHISPVPQSLHWPPGSSTRPSLSHSKWYTVLIFAQQEKIFFVSRKGQRL